MSTPQTLTRSLAARVATLPPVTEIEGGPAASPEVLAEAVKALDAGRTHYTDRPGILPLREKVSGALAHAGLTVKPDAITITCGLIEGRFVAFKQLLKPNGTLTTAPSHIPTLTGVAALLGLTLVSDVSVAADVCYVAGAAELDTALASPAQWIVCEYQTGEQYHLPSEQAARVLFIGEFEQLTGWRVGFMAGSSAAGKLRAYKQSMTICTPSVSQWAATGLTL